MKLEYGKLAGNKSDFKAYAKEIYDYFKADPKKHILAGTFGNAHYEGGFFTTGPDATAFCLRGAWHQLAGLNAMICYWSVEEQEFFNWLGFGGSGYSAVSDAAEFNNQAVRAGNPQSIVDYLTKYAA